MDQNAKIFVAGHRGLVGSALLRTLQSRGYSNLVTRTRQELDLTDQQAVDAFFDSERPQYVFLSAAKVGGIAANSTFKADFISVNLAIALNVIRAAARTGVVKLMNFGSSCIYPRLAPQPISEEALLTGPLEPTNEPYAIAKIAAIKLCRYYNEQYGTNFLSVMPTNLYGSNDNFNLQTSHVLPAMIRKFVLARFLRNRDDSRLIANIQRYPIGFGLDESLDKSDAEAIRKALASLGISAEEVVLWGTGSPYREFLHVDDLAEACVFLMERYNYSEIGELINIGTGEDLTIKELAGLIQQVVGFEGAIRFDSSKPDGTPRKLLDVRRMTALGWRARIKLAEGVREVVSLQLAGN